MPWQRKTTELGYHKDLIKLDTMAISQDSMVRSSIIHTLHMNFTSMKWWFWTTEIVANFVPLTCQSVAGHQALRWCVKSLPGWITEELHRIAEITPPWSGEDDAFLRVQVKSNAKLDHNHYYRYSPHDVLTTFSPWPGRWKSRNGDHLFFCASLLSLSSWSATRIIRALPCGGQFGSWS